jgi:homoserine O-acetyltransferase
VDLFTETPLTVEDGEELGGPGSAVTVAYETWGTLNEDASNAILVPHALTGDSHAAGPETVGHAAEGWWDALIGPGLAIDTNRFFVVSSNVLGGCQGTTGPSSLDPSGKPWGSRFPVVTIRDQATVEFALADALGIDAFYAVIGGSMGGMRALEMAIMEPHRVGRLVLLATGPAATAEQIALCHAQAQALILDPGFHHGDYYDAPPGEGPWRGLGAARRIGQITYRTRAELIERFGRQAQGGENALRGGRYAVESYLDHHAEKLSRRFDANTYLVLCTAMNHHDVGRGRGGIDAALGQITAPTTVIGFDTDRLYLLDEQQQLVDGIPGAAPLITLSSRFGHDAFLVESDAISPHLVAALV